TGETSRCDSRCELVRRSIIEGAVRGVRVVLFSPGADLLLWIRQRHVPVGIQTLITQPAVEAFHSSVLHRLSWLDVHQLDGLLLAPAEKVPRRELRPVV